MVKVIRKEKVPVYELECFECKSILHYTRSDVSLMHITCPVCGCSNLSYLKPVEEEEEK